MHKNVDNDSACPRKQTMLADIKYSELSLVNSKYSRGIRCCYPATFAPVASTFLLLLPPLPSGVHVGAFLYRDKKAMGQEFKFIKGRKRRLLFLFPNEVRYTQSQRDAGSVGRSFVPLTNMIAKCKYFNYSTTLWWNFFICKYTVAWKNGGPWHSHTWPSSFSH